MGNISKKDVSEILKILIFVFLLTMIIVHAWLCDDAFISFRVVKNFVNGFGLRWNTFERVQVFTNPLMVLSLIPLYAITHEIFYTSIFFNIITSIIAIYILMYKISKNTWISILIGIFLLLSKSFMSFTTSGLENSVTFLLLAIFYYIFFKKDVYEKKDILLLSFIASLILLNRMDSILLVIPSFVYILLKRDKKISIFKFALYFIIGMLPFIFWEIFSLLYYGFLFPNTYYAKLNTGIPKMAFIINGWVYLSTILMLDPATILIILLTLALFFIFGKVKEFPLLIGIILSIVYIIYVGGDFMLGRFLTPALFVSTICLARLNVETFNNKFVKAVFIVILAAYVGFQTNYQINLSTLSFNKTKGVADERKFYFRYTSFIKGKSEETLGKINFFLSTKYSTNTYVASNIGFMGYFANDDVAIIDLYALSDPLLSRIPINSGKLERIGHNTRYLPPGYAKTVDSKKNVIKGENLSKYYDVIKIITQDDILSKERLKTIIKYHLGDYDYLIDNYLKEQKNVE